MEPEYREWLIDFGDSDYAVRYRYDGQTAVILAVRHQRELESLQPPLDDASASTRGASPSVLAMAWFARASQASPSAAIAIPATHQPSASRRRSRVRLMTGAARAKPAGAGVDPRQFAGSA